MVVLLLGVKLTVQLQMLFKCKYMSFQHKKKLYQRPPNIKCDHNFNMIRLT